MQRPYFFLLLTLALLISGCVPVRPSGSMKSLENPVTPTSVPTVLSPTETAKSAVISRTPPADCPVTTSKGISFQAPPPYALDAPWANMFWYGTEGLWTALQTDGIWWGLPDNPEGYTQKIMWWSDLFVLKDELQPALVVTGRRLDAEAPPLKFYGATNASAGDIGDAMLTGVDFPTLGCWEITGQYKKYELKFVVWIAP